MVANRFFVPKPWRSSPVVTTDLREIGRHMRGH
jgi:hypothetical protein